MDRAEYAAILQALGHYRVTVVRKESGRCYFICECGAQSTTRINEREAISSAEHHRRKVIAEARKNGRVLPRAGAARA